MGVESNCKGRSYISAWDSPHQKLPQALQVLEVGLLHLCVLDLYRQAGKGIFKENL